jgi:hypothetical protein
MRTLYQAASAIEAHMLVDLLKQQGLSAEIHGEHLQGAIGELPAAGLVRLVVDDPDYAAARAVIDHWESAQPADTMRPATPTSSAPGWGRFAVGLAIGVGAMWALYRVPAATDGIDRHHDGRIDEKRTYAASGTLLSTEIDRNLDGKIDYVTQHDRHGVIETASADDDFDGVFETRMQFRDGNLALYEVDTDHDGIVDRHSHYTDGVLTSTEIIDPASGLPLRVEHYRLGVVTRAEVDTDHDGSLDTRLDYTPQGEIRAREPIGP